MDSGSDLPLLIPVKSITDYFTCAVCVSSIENAYMTPCGHKFCEPCIRECVNRRHRCPICNREVTAEKLVKDHQFDYLLDCVRKEKDKAEKAYFENLFQKAADEALSSPGEAEAGGEGALNLSPVETVLRKHLRKSLTAYQEYLLKFHGECRRKMEVLSQKREAAGDACSEDGEEKKKRLQERFECCSEMLAESYDKYLTENLTPPTLVPLQVSMRVPSRNVVMAGVLIKPLDSTTELREALKQRLESRGEKVVSVNEAQFILVGPLAKEAGVEITEWSAEIADDMKLHSDVVMLEEGCHPLIQHEMRPGSELVVVGKILLECDLPKQCFAVNFQKEAEQKMDYFSCRDCGFNWICKNCSEVCHENHATAPYIMAHVPTWACCYCPKKKKCVINKPHPPTS